MVGFSAGSTLVGFLLPIVASWLPVVASWPAPVVDYRAVLYTDNATAIALAAAALRTWMAANDPDYPLYHLAPPEGHANDPNGVTWDAARGLYHRFYQYDRTYDESCMHGNYTDCDRFSRNGTLNPAARAWGQTTSRDLVHWEEWPAIVGDSEWDWRAVYSGNCALDDRGDPVCVYTGGREAPCDTGVCATSRDWIHWEKRGCMLTAPSPKSQTNHDSALLRLRDGTWVVVVGGCTYNGGNVPNGTCMGNAQLWRSDDLSTFRYWKPLGAAEGPGTYWELPYLLGFDEHGTALPNDAIEDASTTALLFGEGGNKYFFGSLADDVSFSRAWAEPKETDAFPPYYSFNPHATDEVDGTTRRLMFGWILVFGPTSRVSAAAEAGRVPPWDGAHSLCRAVTADAGAGALVQAPCPETRALRGIRAGALANKRLADGVFVGLSNVGDALDVVASFDVGDADAVRRLFLRRRLERVCRDADRGGRPALARGISARADRPRRVGGVRGPVDRGGLLLRRRAHVALRAPGIAPRRARAEGGGSERGRLCSRLRQGRHGDAGAAGGVDDGVDVGRSVNMRSRRG